MFKVLKTKVMNNQKEYFSEAGKVLVLLAVMLSITLITGTAGAKSLYVLSDINGNANPIQAYDIAPNGTLTFQAEYPMPKYNGGAVGMAIDSDSGYLFLTYSYWNKIILVNTKTMVPVTEMETVPNSWDLCGIVYNHKKDQLYCVDRGRSKIWVYNWDPNTEALTLVEGAPFTLKYATAYGISLDEKNQLLYVANGTNRVYVYSTLDWSLQRTVTLNRLAVSVAVDVSNSYLYTGGGYLDNPYLTQYSLKTNTQFETLVEPDGEIGVIGVAVDPNSSKVYITTGHNYLYGGDRIRVFDKLLHPISSIQLEGDPTGLVIPVKEVGYNPLNLKKVINKIENSEDLTLSDSVNAGDYLTYRISFNNFKNEYTVTNVEVIDILPPEVSFVSADDNGIFGDYNDVYHTYTWLYPSLVKGSSAFVDIKVKVNENILPKTSITNTVTISSDSTPPVTRRADAIIGSIPLNIKKTVFGAVEGLTKWVGTDEVITYNIHVDNNDNNFAATDVMVTDILPQEMVFMKADDDLPGVYDANIHTYTWTIPYLGPQEDIELGITVRLNEDTPDGVTVTNTATVESIETALAESSVDVKAGDGPVIIKNDNIQVIPGTNIRKDSALANLMVIMEMPLGYKAKDVQNTPLYITLIGESGGATIASKDQVVLQQQDKTYVVAVFDKGKLMLAVPGYGPKSFEITGTLADSGLFSGFITLNISRFTGF